MIYVRALGPPTATVDGEPAPPELLWRKNLALVVYLARSPHRSRTREHLRGLLWGEKPEAAARHSLNEALRVIRRVGGDEVVRSDGRHVALDPDAVVLDVDRLEEQLRAERWDRAAALVGGVFLEGFGVPDASGFEDWMAAERALWLRASVRALEAHATDRLGAGDVDAARRAAGRALALDPLSDAAIRAAIRTAALAGERAAALEIYAAFEARMQEELGARPEQETVRLADRIRLERSWRLPEAMRRAEMPVRRAPLVGRSAELAEALHLWEEVRRGEGAGLLVVEGDPGVGKTRLAEEVAARARLEGGVVAGIRAVPADRDIPAGGLTALLHSGLVEAPGLVAAPAGALAAAGAAAPEWAERFAGEIGSAAPEPLAAAFPRLLRPAAEEQPLLLFVDDAEWLDAESARALGAALRDLEELPFLLLLALTRDPGHGALDELRARSGREVRGTTVALAPLEADALRGLAAWALPEYGPEPLDRLVRRVAADSAGLPLLAVELLQAVRLGLELEEGRDEAWPAPHRTLDQTLPGDLPDAVVSAIRVAFRRLSPDAQALLAAASVLGDRVRPEVLERATGVSGDRLARALDELEWERWLVSDPRGYGFVARIVARVVERDMMTAGQRRRIQESALETAEKA